MSNNDNYKGKIQFEQQICNKPHIYKITNQINDKYYYGVHDGSNTENYEGSGKLLHHAYEKYGKENFKKEILIWFDTKDEAYEYEEVVVNEKMINKNNPMCYNICKGGRGGDLFLCQTPERQTEIRQKRIDTLNNKTKEEKAEWRQIRRDAWNNKSIEEKAEISRKLSKAGSGENNSMFGKNAFANKTEEEMKVINQKKSEKASRKYYCPHNPSIQRDARNMVQYITKNYPQLKQWSEFTKEEKQSYLVSTPEASGLIVI